MYHFRRLVKLIFAALLTLAATAAEAAREPGAADVLEADVCVYAATPSGILAAVAVKQQGYSVVVVEPSRWVGGILGAGLKPMQDCPNYAATGGMTRTLLQTLGQPGGELKVSGTFSRPALGVHSCLRLGGAASYPVGIGERGAATDAVARLRTSSACPPRAARFDPPIPSQ